MSDDTMMLVWPLGIAFAILSAVDAAYVAVRSAPGQTLRGYGRTPEEAMRAAGWRAAR